MLTLDRQILLEGAQSPLMLLCHLVTVASIFTVVIILSRDERQLVPRFAGWVLLFLRLGILATILLFFSPPIIRLTTEETQVNRILIGIDLSDSMRMTDRHATPAEKLRTSRGLELVGNMTIQERFDRWQLAYDSGQQPEWVRADETQDESRRKALEESRQAHLESVFREVDQLSRREILRRLLVETRPPILDQFDELGRLELFIFAGETESIDGHQLENAIRQPSVRLRTDRSELSKALQKAVSDTNDIQGLILFTDGRDLSGQDLSGLAAQLKSLGTPVFPVLIGSQVRPRDLGILHLGYPQSVFKGDHSQLKVVLATSGFEGKSIDIELKEENAPDADPIQKTIVCHDSMTTIEFELDANSIGRKSFTVKTPVQQGEIRDDNNSRAFSFNVVDECSKVMLIDGEARWEFRYLNAALSRDDGVQLKSVLSEQPFLGALNEPFFSRHIEIPEDSTNPAASPFAEFDLVILGDVSHQHFSEKAWQHLTRFVSEGGTLVISAGARHMPLGHASPAIDQLLPVKSLIKTSLGDKTQKVPPSMRGLPITLTPDGEQQPMLQLAPNVAENTEIWRELPGQTWALLGEAKASATVWATTQLPPESVNTLDTDRRYGVIVHQSLGTGQVVWIGFDGTWRWRYRVGDKYHHRFWAQLARWAATSKMSSGTDVVCFGAENSELQFGQEAIIRARWSNLFLGQHPNLISRAEFYRQADDTERPLTTIDLIAKPATPLIYEGRAAGLPAGEYLVRLVADQELLDKTRIETKFNVSEKPSQEMHDLSANPALLAQIAELSGGRLFLMDEVHDLPNLFKMTNQKTTTHQELTLWDRWPWLLIVFSLMMSEWVVRKLNGLP